MTPIDLLIDYGPLRIETLIRALDVPFAAIDIHLRDLHALGQVVPLDDDRWDATPEASRVRDAACEGVR